MRLQQHKAFPSSLRFPKSRLLFPHQVRPLFPTGDIFKVWVAVVFRRNRFGFFWCIR